ncbi:cysteine desulfurase family protein [Clostridium paridis]|uniref:Cysteine desulfurase n=1 Tax=Clostridium paridis TaxID=2803863 RepID=A0A937K5J2_9CLOT|nr:cysteine desulfurase family protein [Clostridium paridis]MBL4932415.1 cysteine desulfurase [Clostridium paridis]
MIVYFDNAATTKPIDEVIEAVNFGMREYFGNPSSLHRLGLEADRKLLSCREAIAGTINAIASEIYFTSGGSEGNNFILKSFGKKGSHIITTKFEHPSVLNTLKELKDMGAEVTELTLDSEGRIDIEELKRSIKKETVLVSIMHVNNEVGTIQNLLEIGKTIKELSSRARFHVDAVQSYGKIEIDVNRYKIDFLTASGHKIHGPKGVGFCFIRKGLNPKALISGGGQESGFRSGTENVPSVIGMTEAAVIAHKSIKENFDMVKELKRYFISLIDDLDNKRINSKEEEYISPYILNVSFPGIKAEVLLHLLEEKDIFVSTGSACSSRGGKGKYVLKAIGLNEKDSEGAIRFSFSRFSTKEEIDYTIEELKKALTFLRRVRK